MIDSRSCTNDWLRETLLTRIATAGRRPATETLHAPRHQVDGVRGFRAGDRALPAAGGTG